MRTIWKYTVPPGIHMAVLVPEGGEAVFAGIDPDNGSPAVWVEVDSSRPQLVRQFLAVGTGNPIPPGWKYAGSAIDAPFVWHIYEATP